MIATTHHIHSATMLRAPSGIDSRPSTAGTTAGSSNLARITNAKKREYETVVAFEQSSSELRDTFAMFTKQMLLAEEGADCMLLYTAMCVLVLISEYLASCRASIGKLATNVCYNRVLRR